MIVHVDDTAEEVVPHGHLCGGRCSRKVVLHVWLLLLQLNMAP